MFQRRPSGARRYAACSHGSRSRRPMHRARRARRAWEPDAVRRVSLLLQARIAPSLTNLALTKTGRIAEARAEQSGGSTQHALDRLPHDHALILSEILVRQNVE